MAEIFAFPIEGSDSTSGLDLAEAANDRFLLDEGLEVLGDFRSIEDRAVRDSLRSLIKAMALASRRTTAARS